MSAHNSVITEFLINSPPISGSRGCNRGAKLTGALPGKRGQASGQSDTAWRQI